MPRGSDLSVADKLLVAALGLEDDASSFTAEDLVVAAWRKYPDTFGLRGYVDADGRALYPDSNRVFAEIMGTKPLRSRGYVEKSGSKTYRLTEAGRQRARGLDHGQAQTVQRSSWDRRKVEEFRRLRASRAAEKFAGGRMDELTFYDACAFWGISPRSSANDLSARLAHTTRLIHDAVELTTLGPAIVEQGRMPVTAEDAGMLQKMHDDLQTRFVDQLAVLRRRTDER